VPGWLCPVSTTLNRISKNIFILGSYEFLAML
jgi:hypothetical protein